jgi:DNA-binding FadR family transcriptional regulator
MIGRIGSMPRLTAAGPRELAALIVAASPGGDARLPAERQLALKLGVPRSAIRHAMAVLQAEGRISREVGRGTFLRDRAASDIDAADYSPADVMLVRRMFEPHAMSLVVAWATAPDFTEMDRCLHGGNQAADQAEFEVWDGALHRAIIAATHSPLLIRLYAEVEQARRGKVWGDLKRRSATAARREEYRRDHTEIVEALRLRAADAAAEAMRAHLARVARHLLGTELPVTSPGARCLSGGFQTVRRRCRRGGNAGRGTVIMSPRLSVRFVGVWGQGRSCRSIRRASAAGSSPCRTLRLRLCG